MLMAIVINATMFLFLKFTFLLCCYFPGKFISFGLNTMFKCFVNNGLISRFIALQSNCSTVRIADKNHPTFPHQSSDYNSLDMLWYLGFLGPLWRDYCQSRHLSWLQEKPVIVALRLQNMSWLPIRMKGINVWYILGPGAYRRSYVKCIIFCRYLSRGFERWLIKNKTEPSRKQRPDPFPNFNLCPSCYIWAVTTFASHRNINR